MGTINWTKDQQQIIDMRGCNILVSAAAGSGKTAVLVERIFKRITDKKDPVNVDQFVVVTFTKLAAAQMKDRLRERIEEALAKTRQMNICCGRRGVFHLHTFLPYIVFAVKS